MKKVFGFCLGLFAVSLICFYLVPVQASAVRAVETEGSIGFYGKYIPIGEPNPEPPAGEPSVVPKEPPLISASQKPGGLLPQTNDQSNNTWFWLGVIFLLSAFYWWRTQKKKIHETQPILVTKD